MQRAMPLLLCVALVGLATVTAAQPQPQIVGYYSWNWGPGSTGPPGYKDAIGVAFTGYTNVTEAVNRYYSPFIPGCCPNLTNSSTAGGPWITIGGGNAKGEFTPQNLQGVIDASPGARSAARAQARRRACPRSEPRGSVCCSEAQIG